MMQFLSFPCNLTFFQPLDSCLNISHWKIVNHEGILGTLILNSSKIEFVYYHLDNIYDKLKIVQML